jgi:pimeloyl-ACP methyl ester carboxylesterase
MSEVPDNSVLYRTADGYQQILRFYDQSLAGLGLRFQPIWIDTGFGSTHAVRCGNESGKVVVLWHGLNSNLTSWIHWIPALAPAYSLCLVDTIGDMGKSSPTRPGTKGLDYGVWAAEVLRGLGVGQANHVGASNGGWLLLKLANVAPELIASAVLMSSAGFGGVDLRFVLQLFPRVLFKPASEAADGLYALLSPPGLPPDPFFTQFFRLTLASGFRSKPTPPRLPDREIQRLGSPTCFLVGEYERTFDPHKALARAQRLLPNLVAAEVVPGVGHGMIHREPAWVHDRVIRFLEAYAV